MSEILQVTDAVKYYGNESVAVRALAGVSFSMQSDLLDRTAERRQDSYSRLRDNGDER